MPIAPNQMEQHLSSETKEKIRKAKRPKKVEDGGFKSQWIVGKDYVPPKVDERTTCPF